MGRDSSSSAVGGAASSRRVLPMTTLDRVLVGSFATFFVIGVVVDYINAFGPANGITRENTKDWNWPPQVVWDLYFWWARICDPVLAVNPVWIKYLSLLSPVVFCPFYLLSIWAIVTRREWIRIPIIIYSSILFIDLSAFFVEGIYGDLPSPNMWIFTAGYGYYQIFPVIAIARFWKDHPFTIDPPCAARPRVKAL